MYLHPRRHLLCALVVVCAAGDPGGLHACQRQSPRRRPRFPDCRLGNHRLHRQEVHAADWRRDRHRGGNADRWCAAKLARAPGGSQRTAVCLCCANQCHSAACMPVSLHLSCLQTRAQSPHCAAGLWVENLGDVFVALAFPTAERPGPTFAVIWLVRVAENLLYLWFQLNIWFKFRIWIKGKFKKDQVRASCMHACCAAYASPATARAIFAAPASCRWPAVSRRATCKRLGPYVPSALCSKSRSRKTCQSTRTIGATAPTTRATVAASSASSR
jgi:hypothetical protein